MAKLWSAIADVGVFGEARASNERKRTKEEEPRSCLPSAHARTHGANPLLEGGNWGANNGWTPRLVLVLFMKGR